MVRFGKNGTDGTSAAIRLARAFTGRDMVLALGYHGWQDWYVGATVRNEGVPPALRELTRKLPYNDFEALADAVAKHEGHVAAVILEPMAAAYPHPGYLEAVRELTAQNGIVLVFDEVITGFRFALGGAQAYFGVTPDLACFGKAMANGMPISTVLGRADIMRKMEDVFYSGTFGGEALSLAAAIATIDKLEREDVIGGLWARGDVDMDHGVFGFA
jgi:glutamate-1-semialdehyde 2,1-aminomutase/spore coat polysaccharide biosynthesis protein SpsF